MAKGWPKLLECLKKDWAFGTFADKPSPTASGYPAANFGPDGLPDPNRRVIVTITGDLTEAASDTEFEDAQNFVTGCTGATITGWTVQSSDIFLVPGNHDLLWNKKTPTGRWLPYTNFYENLTKTKIGADKPENLTRVIDQSNNGLIVVEINSCAYIEKEKENRGQVDQAAITELRNQLQHIDEQARRRAIKVALIHHHPVHLPGLAEANEGYSAVVNSNALLERLRDYGFHIVLHGHKHVPFTFWYDPACAWIKNRAYPLMITAGGSVSSTEVLPGPGVTNTYNMITLRWDPLLERVRIHVETRGLRRTNDDNSPLDPTDWRWETLRVSDRHFELPRDTKVSDFGNAVPATSADVAVLEPPRQEAIRRTRRNFPVAEILPSLDPQQGNEARVRIEGQVNRPDYQAPEKVEWWAGTAFENVVTVFRDQDPTFASSFTYWGPMLIQAKMYWSDGSSEFAWVFAPLPTEGKDR